MPLPYAAKISFTSRQWGWLQEKMADELEIGEVIRRVLDDAIDRATLTTSISKGGERRPVGRPRKPKPEPPPPPPPRELTPDEKWKKENEEYCDERMQIPKPGESGPPSNWEPHP